MNRFQAQVALFLIVAASALPFSSSAQSNMFDGKPVFAEGVDLGYYVWREEETWHVRWTTQGQARRFSGSISAEGGKLKSLKRIDVESERRVLYPGRAPRVVYGPRGRPHARGGRPPVVVERKQDMIEKDGDNRIVFDSMTIGDIDGFDFKVDEKVTSLRFLLEIGGRSMPQRVEVGQRNRKVPSIPFVVDLD